MNNDNFPDVIGIGTCTADMLFVVPQVPAYGRSWRASQYLRQGGGPVSTALVTLARLGVSARFVGRAGDDPEGVFIREEFQKEGVDVSRFILEPNVFSRAVLVLVDQATGERCFTSRRETNTPLAISDLDRQEIESAKVLHLDDAEEASVQAAKWAKAAGVTVALDGTWYSEELEELLLPLVDMPIVSEAFAQGWMPGASPEAVVERLYEFGARIAAVTLGERGCVAKSEAGILTFPAFSVDVVDTTGAGDAFHGGFIYGALQDWDAAEIIRFASAVASLNCRQLGGRSGLPTVTETHQFLEQFPATDS
jgi:ribokinase